MQTKRLYKVSKSTYGKDCPDNYYFATLAEAKQFEFEHNYTTLYERPRTYTAEQAAVLLDITVMKMEENGYA